MMEFGFFLKKFITFFLEPFGMVFTLFVVGLYFLFQNKYVQAKIFIGSTFVIMFLFSYQPLSNSLIKNLEENYAKYEQTQKVKYIHVLGGGDALRVVEGVILYNKIEGSKLIFTGYAGDKNITSAKKNEALALALGVKKEDIILEESSKDTLEEAIFTKGLLDGEPFILVTSAAHMTRSMALFNSLGLHPIAASSDFRSGKSQGFLQAPRIEALQNSTIALHEYLGILWGKVKSFI